MRILTATLLLMISEMAIAGPLEEANSAYDKGDYVLARNLYGELAHQGDRTAQFKLGVMYEESKGVAKDSREAVRWYSVASAQGFPEAAFNLGRLYHDGRGIPQNYRRARQWYLIAAKGGESKAAVNLGVMDASGEGGPRDYKKAIGWFLFAAQHGDDIAKNNLGTMYLNGQGVPRDLVRAHMWYNLASAKGDPKSDPKQNLCCPSHEFHATREGAGDGKPDTNVCAIISKAIAIVAISEVTVGAYHEHNFHNPN